VISSLFFLSYSSIAFVGLVEFEHFVCSCHCICCIGLSSPRRFGSESLLSFLLLGSWNPRQHNGLVGLLGDLQLSCGDLPKLCGALVAISWGPPVNLWRSSQALWCLSGDFLGASN
jgi:hypothetical protein